MAPEPTILILRNKTAINAVIIIKEADKIIYTYFTLKS